MEKQEKTKSFGQCLLWFGAAVSIAEILTGALLAPLGLKMGILAILIGHLIGGIIFYLTGYIGAESGLSAIESTRISFGRYGSYFFSILNVIQLLGWTAVMIINGAKALDGVTQNTFQYQNEALWCVIIGGLICVWILVGLKNLSKVSAVAVSLLFLFTLVLGWTVFHNMSTAAPATSSVLSFGAAVELSVTMPLSWLPLISDYTRTVKHKKGGTAAGTVGYFIGSCMMYVIGLGAAIYAGTSDIAQILIAAGLGVIALLIVLLSTVTTTFLDAYSGGVSIVNCTKKLKEKPAALAVCLVGTLIAIFVPIQQYENFLYFIGSVFAPLFAVLITDYYILKKKSEDSKPFHLINAIIWLAGVIAYRVLLNYDSPVGTTLPVMAGVSILCILIEGGKKLCSKKS